MSVVLIYASYFFLYGITCSFQIVNTHFESEYYEPLDLTQIKKELKQKEARLIDVILIVNGKVVYQDLISSNNLEPVHLNEKMKFGLNNIQIYSSELNLYVNLYQRIYISNFFKIRVSSEVQYFKDGTYVDLGEIEGKILSGELEDYSIKNHDRIFYSGITFERSRNFFPRSITTE